MNFIHYILEYFWIFFMIFLSMSYVELMFTMENRAFSESRLEILLENQTLRFIMISE